MLTASDLLSKSIQEYNVEALLYENGVTAIFVAQKKQERVVLKVGISEEAKPLLERELRILSSLRHPRRGCRCYSSPVHHQRSRVRKNAGGANPLAPS